MTLSTTANKVSYAGDGATVSFAIPFPFLENGHMEAVLRDAAGVETTWSLNTEFTLTGAGAAAGGTLAVSVSPTDFTPATGDTLVIRRVVPETQETDYPEGGAFPASAHEQALDKLTMLVQQHSEEIARAPALPVSSPLTGLLVPEPGASEVIRWNATGTALETVGVADLSLAVPASVTTPAVGDALVYNGTLWANRPAGVASVRDHGVVGDGTADDTVALQAAFNAAQGGALALVRGETYRVTDSILVPEGTTVFGNGAEIKFVITGATKCLDVRSGCRIYDLKSTCQITSPMGNTVFHCPVVLGDTVPEAVAVRDVVLENIELVSDRVGGNLMGLFGDVSNVRIRNVYIPATSTPYIGILLHWGGDTTLSDDLKHPHAITIDGVVCDGLNSGNAASSVIFLSTPYAVSVSNVYAQNVDSLAQVSTGTYGNSKSTAEFDDLVLYGISIRDCVANGTVHGVKIIDQTASLYSGDFQIIFDNIRLYGNDTGTGLDVQRCLNLVWSNCHIEKFVNGIRIGTGAQGCTFRDGTIKDTTTGGITCSAATHRHKIYGMNIEDINQSAATTADGAMVEVQGDDWVIRDCILGLSSSEGAYYGISVTTGSRTLIDNIYIRDVAAAGKHLYDDGTGTVVTNLWPNDSTLTTGGAVGYLGTNIAEAWRLHKNGTNQTGVVTATATKVTWATAAVDTNSRFDNANDRITIQRAGVYEVGAAVVVRAVADAATVNVWVYVNGTKTVMLGSNTNAGAGLNSAVSGNTNLLLAKGDYVEIYVLHNHGSDRDVDGSITDGSNFHGHKIA